MSRAAVVQAATAAIGGKLEPPKSSHSLVLEWLSAAGLSPKAWIQSEGGQFFPPDLRSIGWPEPGERRSKDNVPLAGDVVYFDGLAGIITAIGETLTVVLPVGDEVAEVDYARDAVPAIYSIRILLDVPGTDEEEHEKHKARLRAGESEEDLRADGVSLGDVRRAAAALVPEPTDEERAAAELAATKASVRAEADARLERIRRSAIRDALHLDYVKELRDAGKLTAEEAKALDPQDKTKPKSADAAVALSPELLGLGVAIVSPKAKVGK